VCSLLDLHYEGALSLDAVVAVAIDECDKMLGLGFAAQLERLARLLLAPSVAAPAADAADNAADSAASVQPTSTYKHAKKRKREELDVPLVPHAATLAAKAVADFQRPQVLLFSATTTATADSAFEQWVTDSAQRINVAEEPAEQMSSTVTQVVQVCAEHKKPAKLLKHLRAVNAAAAGARALPRVLVFCNKVKVRHPSSALRRTVRSHGTCRVLAWVRHALHDRFSYESEDAKDVYMLLCADGHLPDCGARPG
jgi:ATP-dependent RNA helicase DDX5/DBP2